MVVQIDSIKKTNQGNLKVFTKEAKEKANQKFRETITKP